MTRTDAFANDFCRRMEEKGSGAYEWTPSGKPLGKGHEGIDILGTPKTSGRKLILVEAELRKYAPLTNVVKVWRWVEDEGFKKPFVFVQAFSKYYKESDTKRLNSEFVGRQLQRATGKKYLPISFDYNPYRHGKQGAGKRRDHAYKLADKVRRVLRSLDVVI